MADKIEFRPRGHVINHNGSWIKAAASICTTTTLPSLLALSYALASLGWVAGLLLIALSSFGTFYCLFRLVQLNDYDGKSHDNYPDLATTISGKKSFGILVRTLQFVVNWGVGVANVIMAGAFMDDLYEGHCNDNCSAMGTTTWTLVAAGAVALIGLLPDLSERNLLIIISGSFTIFYTTVGIVLAFTNNTHSTADFSLVGSSVGKVFNALNALGILFFLFGDTMYPEVQSYLKPDACGSTVKPMIYGMYLAFSITIPLLTVIAIAGYWSFGNAVSPILFTSAWVPQSLVVVAVITCIIQLVFSVQMFAQPIYFKTEPALLRVLPKWSWMHATHEVYEDDDVYGTISAAGDENCTATEVDSTITEKNQKTERKKKTVVVPSYLFMAVFRTLYAATIAFIAVFFNFFTDIMGFIGAVGVTPLTFVFPLTLYLISKKGTIGKVSKYIHIFFIILFTCGGTLAAIGAVRNIVVQFSTFKLG